MEVVEAPQKTEHIHLLLAWDTAADQARSRRAGTLSIITHIVGLLILISIPAQVFRPPETHQVVTPLVFPLQEPTQKSPNTARISKSFHVEDLVQRPSVKLPETKPSTTRPRALKPPPVQPPKPAVPPPMIEPPKVDAVAKESPKLPVSMTPTPAPPPQIQTEEKPKLAFETPSAASTGPAVPKEALPSASVSDIMHQLARGDGGGVVVGDAGIGEGGFGAAINQPSSAGRQKSQLQLLSDPMGVDFRPYLLQVLQTVRRNWFAVMPESARLGRRGTVALQFAVEKSGNVAKIVFASNSGVDSLDRAAVASISMANPLPPLPVEFRGGVIRLQLTFAYNNAK